MLFRSRLELQQYIGPRNRVNDLSIEREIAPNLFSFKHICFPFISSGIILHEWILCHRNIYVANVAAVVRYCIYNADKIYENLSIIVTLSAIVYRLFSFRFSPPPLDVNHIIGAIKENNGVPAFFPLLFCCVSSGSTDTSAFSTGRFAMNVAPHSRSASIGRAAAGVSSVSASLCPDDGWT